MSSITPEILKEWAIREKAYYTEADKWKALEENMKRQRDEQLAEWKRKDEALKRYQELNTYSEQEIREVTHQIRMDRLKIILNS